MLALARWLSETPLGEAARALDGLVPILQTVHILAVAMILSSTLMIALRVFDLARSAGVAETVRRFEAWIWSGFSVLAVSGAVLILIEPQRTLPNGSFQLKIVLLTLAGASTFALCRLLRRTGAAGPSTARAGGLRTMLAVVALVLWCGVAAAGRFIAYTQPG